MHRLANAYPFVPSSQADRSAVCQEIFAIQATGLARRLRAVKAKTLVLGLSGGLDSTLALLVAEEALARSGLKGCSILTITMPGLGTTDRTKDNAVLLAKALGVKLRTISIKSAVTQHLKDIAHDGAHDITFENAQARERTQILMDVANQTGGIVLGTGDLSEAALGWCTFNGDHMSMYHVNAGVPKTLVKYLIEWCATQPRFEQGAAVLQDILATPISPELLPASADGKIAQKTEDSVGPYELVDFFLFHLVRHGCGAVPQAAVAARRAVPQRQLPRRVPLYHLPPRRQRLAAGVAAAAAAAARCQARKVQVQRGQGVVWREAKEARAVEGGQGVVAAGVAIGGSGAPQRGGHGKVLRQQQRARRRQQLLLLLRLRLLGRCCCCCCCLARGRRQRSQALRQKVCLRAARSGAGVAWARVRGHQRGAVKVHCAPQARRQPLQPRAAAGPG
jgi:NAD+ synthetase